MSARLERHEGRWAGLIGFLPFVGVVLVAAGCEGLTEVAGDPHTIDASRPIGLQEALVGTTVDLFHAFDSKIVWAGLFGDEFTNSGTSPGIQDFDRRVVTADNGGGDGRGNSIGGGYYVPLQRATATADLLQERLRSGEFEDIMAGTSSPEYARASVYDGFAKTWLADLYCTLAFSGHGPELTAEDAYRLAEMEFTEAINAASAEPEVLQAARVGRARVRLILGDHEGALADAQEVDPEFEFVATYSTNSFAQRNRVHFRTWDFGNWSIGPVFRNLTIDETGAPDARVELALNPHPAFEPSQDLYAPWKVPTASSPLRIATGDEAQYIIAEIRGGSVAVDIINEIRARYGIDAEWAPSGRHPNEIRDKVIDERRRTLFLDGVRLGDLRRYIDQYGLDFFPTSTPRGWEMGDQTCLPMPEIERNNNPGV